MIDKAMQIAMILDRSGSMSSIQAATVEGINAFIADQQNSEGEVNLLLVQFDDKYEQVYSGPIAGAPLLTLAEIPAGNQVRFEPRGSTALLDAMGNTIVAVGRTLAELPEGKRPGKVVMVTMTDGHENSSRKFDRFQIAEMIGHQREVYKWQFQFLAANQDAISTASVLNIPRTGAITYAASPLGARNVMRSASRNVQLYGSIGAAGPMPAFNEEDRASAVLRTIKDRIKTNAEEEPAGAAK